MDLFWLHGLRRVGHTSAITDEQQESPSLSDSLLGPELM